MTDQDAASLDQVVADKDDLPPVGIELTLTERRIPEYFGISTETWTLQDTTLEQDAFRAKTYTIRLEKGAFPVIARNDEVNMNCLWYAFHLNIEPSPYPPLEEWIMKRPADLHEYWKRKDFYRESVEGDGYWDPEAGRSRWPEVQEGRVKIKAILAKQKERYARENAAKERAAKDGASKTDC